MDIELLKAVVEQIKEDAEDKDFTAIEGLFKVYPPSCVFFD